jgi:hypothetical protein
MNGTQLGRRFEKLGRLVADHLQIARLVHIGIVAVHQLQHFAFGNDVGGIGQNAHDAHVADFDHHLEGTRIEEVADQHAGALPNRALAVSRPRRSGLVDHVVMQQRGRMDELDDGRQLVMMVPR